MGVITLYRWCVMVKLSRDVWELALTANGVRVSSIRELYGERMSIYMRPYE